MQGNRFAWPLVAIIALSLAVMSIMAACNNGQRRDTLRVARVGVLTARDAYLRWDRERQMKIVEQSATREERDRLTAEHRDRREKMNAVFIAVHDRLLKASLEGDQKSLDAATAAADKVSAAMKDLDPATPGPDPDELQLKREPCARGEPCPEIDALRVDAGMPDGATP
jgi:hypothetical protein